MHAIPSICHVEMRLGVSRRHVENRSTVERGEEREKVHDQKEGKRGR